MEEKTIIKKDIRNSLKKRLFKKELSLDKNIYNQIIAFNNDDRINYEKLLICPICESKRRNVISKYDRYGMFCQNNICLECGLIYLDPRFDEKSTNIFYQEHYRGIYNSGGIPKNEIYKEEVKRGERILSFTKTFLKKSNNILEVGCGMGGILSSFSKEGFKCKGIDLGADYLKINTDKNIELINASVFEIKEKFDLIIYSHVFEHLRDIEKELNYLKNILTETGVIYIEVPGIFNLEEPYKYNIKKYFQNAHNFSFSLENLTKTLNKYGFELIKGDQKVRSVFKVGSSDHLEMNYNLHDKIIGYINKTEFLYTIRPFNYFTIRQSIINLLKYSRLYKLLKKT